MRRTLKGMNTPPPRVRFYIDAFNFYYGSLKQFDPITQARVTGVCWLDLAALCGLIMPRDRPYQIDEIKYFTARIRADAADPTPNTRTRQEVYLRALTSTTPALSIIYGKYKISKVKGWPTDPTLAATHPIVQIRKPEEKGSDVNLGIHMVRDAALNAADVLAVISDDSDIAGAFDIVSNDFGKEVYYFASANRKPNTTLKTKASLTRSIHISAIRGSQFPDPIIDPISRAVITKPVTW